MLEDRKEVRMWLLVAERRQVPRGRAQGGEEVLGLQFPPGLGL